MPKANTTLNEKLRSFCQTLEAEAELIPSERKKSLLRLSRFCREAIAEGSVPSIIVVCTHNSRRSHLGQLWLAVATDYYNLPSIATYSGGTEATALHPNVVDALRTVGFSVQGDAGEANPRYEITWSQSMEPYVAFSKKYADPPNPQSGFAAVMVCTSADAGCPVVPGCALRLAIPYQDPKVADGTAQETATYAARLREIGREMFWAMRNVDTDT